MFELTTKIHDEARQGEAFSAGNELGFYKRYFYIESYGCQMNFSDSEIVASILQKEGLGATKNIEDADVILLNTCSIREKAEQTIRKRLTEFKRIKKNKPATLVGVLGCMAERLKFKLIEEERLVDIVVGPDAYRTLPDLISDASTGQKGVNVLLSRDETYADITPVRLNSNGVTAYVSIMRGCNNMCSFCVVPFTRGRERSRNADSIIKECKELFESGYREVTLLGQNVDSYYWTPFPHSTLSGSTGVFEYTSEIGQVPTNYKNKMEEGAVTFAQLLEMVALISPQLRVRFSTSHPKDITDEVLFTIARHQNICNYIHLPLQSGSTRILQLMNRNYTREWYISKVDRIKEIIPDCGLSSDVITGFCTETHEDHLDTLSLMNYAAYDFSYMFFYSERPGTLAQRRYKDDIPETLKKKRLQEIVLLQNQLSHSSNLRDLGKVLNVLIEGNSKKSSNEWAGRSSQNKVIVFPKENLAFKPGDYANVKVLSCTQATLIGKIIN
jgi:tRNA-2-methylthio-N6-dimethylallyladenosine synthase